MPACSIVRIACGHGTSQQYWTVQPGGAVRLSSETEAQYFVCHSEVADRSCLIQHLQSGAFIEQADNRQLKLALTAASAAVFSKLRAYSEGEEEELVQDSVWLRAATGGIVCSNAQGELAVTVNAAHDCPARHCSFSFLTADPNSLLMKGLAPQPVVSCPAHQIDDLDASLRLQHRPAPVSIGAKPLSPLFTKESSAMPIAFRRPIRKVSFSDLTSLEHSASNSDHKSVPLYSSLPRNSGSFSRSYTLKDAFSNRIPSSPGYSLHSEGSETDESKVRGGHLFDSDRISSSDSLSHLDEALSGVGDSSTASPPETSAANNTQHQLQQQIHMADSQHDQPSSEDGDDAERSSRGPKMHGGNLYMMPGSSKMRTTQSTSALGIMFTNPSHSASHRAIKGHRTHGSQTALSFLSGGFGPSSPHRIPRAAEKPLDLTQSAPVMGPSWLANDEGTLARGLSRGQSHGHHGSDIGPGSSSSPQSFWGRSRGRQDNSEALASLRLSRVSGDSHREPMLPCILEGLPSQHSESTMGCPPALDELLGRSSLKSLPTNGMKRVCSSPEMHHNISSLHHPAICKVTPRGSPSNPSPSKRLHTRVHTSNSLDSIFPPMAQASRLESFTRL